eukprot:GHVR01179075.1.p1 GENE.GHVR01179075.1~~GHVR01179075.1.p1  ORF type:complete len:296 (+),score=33.75 GHVR01179075.1:127-1014(+)
MFLDMLDFDTILCCRLIGYLTKDTIPHDMYVYSGGISRNFKLIKEIIIGPSSKCLLLIEKEEDKRTFIVFPYFDPKSILDYMTIGTRILTGQTLLDNRTACFVSFAKQLCSDESFRQHVQSGNELVLTGFSMGGGIANAIAYELIQYENYRGSVTVKAFASPRVGNKLFSEWFNANLNSRSVNVVGKIGEGTSAQYDSVSLSPSLSYGFDILPNLYILTEGCLSKPSDADLVALREDPPEKNSLSWFVRQMPFVRQSGNTSPTSLDLHSVFRYYEMLSSIVNIKGTSRNPKKIAE